MIKKSQLRTMLPLIHQTMKSPPKGMSLGNLPGRMPPLEKIILDSSAPSDSPGALGYVTTEDVNNDGTIDKMHLIIPNVEKHLKGFTPADIQSGNLEKLQQILWPFIQIIPHEMAHQKDYTPDGEDPFPGGEQVADQAAAEALGQFSIQATNNSNRNDISRRSNMQKEIISRLVKLAGDLDSKGAHELSDQVTTVAEKYAQEVPFDEESAEAVREGWEEGKRRTYQMQNAQLYHPGGGMTGPRIFTGQVKFDWGTYNGPYREQPYYVASGRTELGSVQFKGDPYTYEPAGEGKLRVISGPEDTRYSINRVIPDPRKKFEEIPSEGPIDPEAGAPSEEEKYKAESLVNVKRKSLSKLDKDIVSRLNKMEAPYGRTYASKYSGKTDYDQKLGILDEAIKFFEGRGQDTRYLKSYRKSFFNTKNEYTEALMRARQHSADDMEIKASLNANELTKNASLNSIFWTPDVKTPFGR